LLLLLIWPKMIVESHQDLYTRVMDRLLKRIQRVRLAAFCCRDFFLFHDNAPVHKAAGVCQFWTPKYVTTLYHSPYSPDLSPLDCFLFPKLKMKLKELHFADVAEIQEAVVDELKKAQKDEFSAAFLKLYDRAKASVSGSGAYFELKKNVCVFLMSSIKKTVLKLLCHTVYARYAFTACNTSFPARSVQLISIQVSKFQHPKSCAPKFQNLPLVA
jgi:hypothetical protein